MHGPSHTHPNNQAMRIATTILAIPLLMAFTMPTSAPDARVFDPAKAFADLKGRSDKFMTSIAPWHGLMQQNEALIPASIKPQYDSFNTLLGGFNGDLGKLATDPTKLTESALKGLNGDLGNLTKQYGELQKLTKDLPFLSGLKP